MSAPQVEWLFKTKALNISEVNTPFWYTSGELGPYYINTHYLCGGEQTAQEILEFITEEASSPATLPAKLLERLERVYQESNEFRAVIDALAERCRSEFPLEEISGISGGQRRDWFFAPLVAKLLDKPCLYLFNDGTVFDEFGEQVQKIDEGVYLNICDLLRVGSSYTSKWVPIIEGLGGKLRYSLSVVDRKEGGDKNLAIAGVEKSLSLFEFDEALLMEAVEEKFLSREQFDTLSRYIRSPRSSMREFLLANPQFIEAALSSEDEKIRKRAESLVEKDYYQLKTEEAE